MKSQFIVEQIIRILHQGESGSKVKDLIREHGIAEQTYYNCKAKYGGMNVAEAQRQKELEAENR